MVSKDRIVWVEKVLGVSIHGGDEGAESEGEDIDPVAEQAELEELGLDVSDLWEGAVGAFQGATETVNAQISQLQAALKETDDPDLHDIANSGLNALTANTRVPLMAAIMEAGKGDVRQLKAAAPKLLKAVAAFRAQLSSPEVRACDDNPFGVEMSIGETFAGALDQITYAAKLAA